MAAADDLDKGFSTSAAGCFQSVIELHDALDGLVQADNTTDEPTYDALMARLDRQTNTDATRDAAHQHQLLTRLATQVATRVQNLATAHGLTRHQTGHSVDTHANPPTAQTSVALTVPTTMPATSDEYVTYLYELHAEDIGLLVDGRPIWRESTQASPNTTRPSPGPPLNATSTHRLNRLTISGVSEVHLANGVSDGFHQ